MKETYEWFDRRPASVGVDPDRALLRTMNQYLVRSLFERVAETCADGLEQALKWQRRMPAPLARVVSGPVYGGAYLSPPDEELAKAGARPLVVPDTFDRPVVFVDTSRYKAAGDTPAKRGNGFENPLEQRMVLRACEIYHRELDRTGARPITVSVLSFYRAQARALDDALDRKSLPLFDIRVVDVIDRIQGQQSDLVVISFVRARDRGAIGPRFGSWLQDIRRLNVACTRARRALVLVGHADTLRRLGTNRDGTPRDANAEPAVGFYRNLFELFDGPSPEFLMLHKFGEGRA
jgi:superfamily I DNA and/or RNA helicase